MNVHSLRLQNFTVHADTLVKFDPVGLMVIIGDNGSGKSSIIEGVAWAGWGKTVRGAAPYSEDAPCTALMTSDGLSITRTRIKGKNGLDWLLVDDGTEYSKTLDAVDRLGGLVGKFDTATKAQEVLENLTGPFDLWRRSHVFSSADAAHFTLATDGERKRLIESFLGLEGFDTALEACRKEQKNAQNVLAAYKEQLAHLVAEDSFEHRRLETARDVLEMATSSQLALPMPADGGRTAADLNEMVDAAAQEMRDIRTKLREADKAGTQWEVAAEHARRLLERISQATCPTCTQPIQPALRKRLEGEEQEAQASAVREKAAANKGREALEQALGELDEEHRALLAARQARVVLEKALEQSQRDEARQAKVHRFNELEVEAALKKIELLSKELTVVQQLAIDATATIGVLDAVERVLGLKGVRAHIIGRALGGLESVANMWLSRLDLVRTTGPVHLRIELKPYSEKKSGNNDAISIEVHGAGGGLGYRASSGGERRRIDVALLMAMAEVASAAHGREHGTIFYDEVFDALDETGTEAVVEALRDMSQEHAVVVITHSQALFERLPDARRLRIDGGVATEVG